MSILEKKIKGVNSLTSKANQANKLTVFNNMYS